MQKVTSATPGRETESTARSGCATTGLWPAQIKAIRGLEDSLAHGRPRALIQMASGGGKTFTACNFCYRLIKHAGAQRILFLVDRNNLGRQAKGEFEQFATPEEHRKFTELYNVQHLKSNKLDPVSKVCITTIQRLFSMLKGEEELDPDIEEKPLGSLESLIKKPVPVSYNPAIPIEFFDFIVVDECHRSIYNLWRQVLEYFDSFLIGLTATPSQQTFGFFNQNLVSEYNHEQAVADQVNVGFDVYRIRTVVSEYGSTVIAGLWVDKRDRQSRKVRWEQLDQDFSYASRQLDQDVVAPDQIRTIIRTFKERLFTEIFPGRTEVPKTLIFAKDDSHAEDIVNIVREEFGKGNDFCQKITYRTGTVRVLAKKKLPDGTEVRRVRLQEHRLRDGGRTFDFVPEQLFSAHCRDRGYDRHGHRRAPARMRHVPARSEEPEPLRADEGPGRARGDHDGLAGGHSRRRGQDPFHYCGCGGRLRDRIGGHPSAGKEAQREL